MISIQMGIGPILFLENLFLYSYEEEYLPSLLFFNKAEARHFH